MKGFELEPGTFFMCTEASPRCFVIQQVNDVDNALKGVQTNSINSGNTGNEQADGKKDSGPPSLPMLPWWFTNECKQQLLNIPSFEAAATGIERVSTPDPNLQMNAEQVKARLKSQLEYYFSRENLINDRYLRCQMDADQFVPIKIVAGFPKIAQLTTDFSLIVQILKTSEHVQVDETGEKVRPNSKRCTIILREIPESADESEVESMFDDCPQKYQSIIYGLNGSWYITFATEEDTRLAFIHLQNLGKTFNDKPVHARIKTGCAPVTTTESTNGQIIIHDQYIGKSICESMDYSSPKLDTQNSYNLGLILAQFGYVPRCTFRPLMAMKDGNGGNVSVNVPISIHTDWHNGSEIDHQLPSATHLSNISADHIIGDHCIKENVQPSNHYSITTTSTTTNTAKKLILDDSATKTAAGSVQQSGYDGFLLTNTPVSNYGMIPNFGRQRITDVPRMNNKNGRKSPLIYASPIMYTTNTNNNNNYYYNNNNVNPNFYKAEENTYHKRNYSTSSSNENRRFDSNRNKETAECTTYPPHRQNNNYNSHYSNPRNYPNNHSSAGFSDNSNTKPYRHRNSNANYQQDRFQPNNNNGCADYNSATVKQPVLQPLTQQNINKCSEGRSQQAWKPAQYSRQSSHSSYKGYSRQNSDANTNTNWRKVSTTRASMDNDNTDSKAVKHNSSGKPIGVAKPLSSTVRGVGTNTSGFQSLTRSTDKISDCEQYRPSDKKSEDIRSFYPNKLDKPTQLNEHDPAHQKKKIECLEEQEYNFVEVEFPSLVEGVDENSKKSSSSTPPQSSLQNNVNVGKSAEVETQEVSDIPQKHVNNPVIASEHKVQFSAIVAGIKMPKQQPSSTVFAAQPDDVGLCASAASKCSYAQTLKKHASK